jgi:YYY domain-containing protein
MLAETFAWWLVLTAVGLIALPITLVLFQRLPGAGIAFARPVGLLLGGYLYWLALTAHLLPNRPGSIVWIFIALAVVDYLLLRRRWRETLRLLESKAGLVLAVELVFLSALLIGSHVRSYIPEITATEKPMDFMFLNALDRSRYYPPEDPWFAGEDVSYYYFGYLIQAMVGNLAAVKTSVAFNLGLTSTAALAAAAAFGLGHDLVAMVRRATFRAAIGAGIAAAIFVTLLGNLEGAVEFGRANGVVPDSLVETIDVANLENSAESSSCLVPVVCIKYPDEETSFWWWWRATRISPDANSITEFPFFSFILGDLHPHVMAIPYTLTGFALGLSLWRSETPLRFETWRSRPLLLLLTAVLIGGLGFLNTWDLPTFGFLLALLVLLRNLAGRPGIAAAADAAGFVAPLAALSVLLYAPFYLTFGSQADGFAAVQDEATKPLHSFLFWAPLLAVALPLPLVSLTDAAARAGSRLAAAVSLPAGLLLLWALLTVVSGDSLADAISDRGANWLTAGFFALALALSLLALWRHLESPAEEAEAMVPVLAATSLALLLIYGAELFYVQDFFGNRLNSVFKLYYQAWLLLGVAGGFGVWWLFAGISERTSLQPAQAVLVSGVAVVVVLALLYPLSATLSRTEGFGRDGRTLDGTLHLQRENADEYRALDWLRQRVDPGERMVEAVGDSYSGGSLVSARTGLPAVLGWPGHELQWARDPAEISRRRADVERVYTTESLEEAVSILRKYGVTYVFVGRGYRETFPIAGIDKFETGLQSVFQSGEVSIYRLPPLDVGASR